GALILEIPGERGREQADLLTGKLREVVEERAKISLPQKMGKLRLRGLEPSTTEGEVAEAVAKIGGCEAGNVRTGRIRVSLTGYRSLWVQCPLAAAKRTAEKGTLAIGWTQVRTEILGPRPLQCFRCMERGQVQNKCSSEVDRSRNCCRCGKEGHLAREC
ncbi:hypothetical protein EAI_09230, partial [Harpegnathos saltator]